VAAVRHRPQLLQAAPPQVQVPVRAQDEAPVEAHPRAEPHRLLPQRRRLVAAHRPLPPGPLTRT
jgi:hypothetical protein